MDDNAIIVDPDQADFLLAGDDYLPTPGSNELQDSLLGSDEDTSGHDGVCEDAGDVRPPGRLAGLLTDAYNDADGNTGTKTSTDARQEMVGMPVSSGQTVGANTTERGNNNANNPANHKIVTDPNDEWGFDGYPVARKFLKDNHTAKHELAANLIDDLTRIWDQRSSIDRRRTPRTFEDTYDKWMHVLTSDKEPADETIETLRQELHTQRNYFCDQLTCNRYTLDIDEAFRVLEYHRTNSIHDQAAELKIELQELTEDDEIRRKVLWYNQSYKTVKDYEDNRYTYGLELTERTLNILAIDFYNARATDDERQEVDFKTKDDNSDQHYAAWREAFKELPKGLQRRCVPCGLHNGGANEGTLLPKGTVKYSESTKREMCNRINNEGRDPGEAVEGEGVAHPKSDPNCCDGCVQCQHLAHSNQQILPKKHHVAQVRVLISSDAYVSRDNDIVYDTFDIVTMRDKHEQADFCLGTLPYWRSQDFYNKMAVEAKKRVAHRWPLDDFTQAGIKYRLKREYIKYKAFDHRAKLTYDEYVYDDDLRTDFMDLAMPHHVLRKDPMNKGRYFPATYSGRFDIRFRVYCDADKAKQQRICYADDNMAKRIKMILNDRKGYGIASDLHIIGAILLTCAAWHRDEFKDSIDPTMPPYPETTLTEAFGPLATKNYKQVLQNSRPKPDLIPNTAARRTSPSSTRGHQEVVRPLEADRNGTRQTSTKSPKDTNKKTNKAKSPVRVTAGIPSYKEPENKNTSSRSTRIIWKPSTIYTNPNRQRPRSMERPKERDQSGGRDGSESRRRTVFERLMNNRNRPERILYDDDKVETKKTRIGKHNRG